MELRVVFVHQRKCLVLILVKQIENFVWGLNYDSDNGYLFATKKEIFKLKAVNKIVNFPAQFCLGRISTGY